MCGFVGAFDLSSGGKPIAEGLRDELRAQVLEMSKKIRHRGPDWSGVYTGNNAILSHERLSIVDPLSGKQPLISDDGKLILAANGEIYNHAEIRKSFEGKYNFLTGSDCEVILPLYKEYRESGNFGEMIEKLSGIFAFALYDSERDTYLIARDEIGVIPLYQGWDKDGHYWVASEMKALDGLCDTITEFPAGSYYDSREGKVVQWYHRDWMDKPVIADDGRTPEQCAGDVRVALEAAVKRQLMSDVPYGVLLSGGLDSSVIAAITARYAKKRVESQDTEVAWWPRLHSFAVGIADSPDLKAARLAAKALGTVHHEVHFTIQEALDAVDDVIYHLETYDITTVRAATPMYLLARFIKSMGIKMVLTGEGSDELFGGYLYFHKAPNAEEFHQESVRKLGKLHLYDLLRANKALAAWGVEGRVPFLDKEFIDVAMHLPTSVKMCPGDKIEKWVVRKAFEDMLPAEIAWRQKEQFSDGVGYSWIDTLKEKTSREVSDEEFSHAADRFPINPPATKEEYYYRVLFTRHFPTASEAKCVPHEASVACSTATALKWDKMFQNMDEPSGRAIYGVHEKAYRRPNA